MQITEPMTMATDFVLAMLCFLLGSILVHTGRKQNSVAITLWGAAFFTTALAAATGGTSHGLALYLGAEGQAVLWKATVYSVGLGSLLLLSAVFIAVFEGGARIALLALAVVQFLVYAVWMVRHDDFSYVIYDYGAAMLVILGIAIWRHFTAGSEWARWVIGGIVISFAAAGIQMSGFTIYKHFNHNDFYHVIQMLGTYLLYRGGMALDGPSHQRP